MPKNDGAGVARYFVLVLLAALALWSWPSSASAQGFGDVKGVVRNVETGETLDYANVVLKDVSNPSKVWGGMTIGGGLYFLRGIPAGEYTIATLYLGFKKIELPVTVTVGQTKTVDFDLEVTVVKTFDEFVIEGSSIMVEVKDSETSYTIGSEDLTDYAVDTVEEAVSRQAGIVSRNGELHVRGGRSGEISFRIDGVAVDDPLGGGAISVSTFSVANIQTVTGGQDPEYGNALSGVVNIETKEGNPDKFELAARFTTDDFGRQDRTFTNYDRLEVGFGGPSFVDKLTYFISGDLRFADQENVSSADRPETTVELFGQDIFKFRRRQVNDLKGSMKLAYTFDQDHKITAEFIGSYTRTEAFLPNWNVQGYTRQLVRLPLLEDGSDGIEFGGRYGTFYYGPWVDNLSSMAVTRPVLSPGTSSSQRQPMPTIELRDIRGEMRLAIAQPVFVGARYNRGLFSTEEEDSSYVAFNAANQGPQNTAFSSQSKIVWRQTINDDTFYEFKVARLEFDNLQTVSDNKLPVDYLHGGIDSPGPFGGLSQQYDTNLDYTTDEDNPFFVTDGSDWAVYNDQNTKQYSMRFDLTSNRYDGHKMKMGVRIDYNDLSRRLLSSPGIDTINRFTGAVQQGAARNIFHSYNPEASFYMQDRWEYEGMVINGGFRWDMFSPGSSGLITLESEELDTNVFKYKHQFSPRLGFAFPITERDGFNFHYGRFVQFPGRDVLFASQDPVGNNLTLGNPNLDEMTTIQYQSGIKHQFNDFLAMQFAVYNRDIFGLVSAVEITDEATGNTLNRYINRAYGNSRGVELTLERRFHKRWAFDIAYTYAFADGVASSQQFGTNPNGLEFLPNQELPLDWDQRHSVAMQLRLAEQGAWGASLVFDYGSGFPWTPFFRFDRRQDPLLENSSRLPAEYDLRIQAERNVNVYGQSLTLYLQGLNLLNQDAVARIQPGLAPGSNLATNAGFSYLTETGKFGGAYLADVDGDANDDFVPINDPRVFSQHRLFRVGLGWRF
jgi:outer membrane receptor protein involved in Fe transport